MATSARKTKKAAVSHLQSCDPKLAGVIARVGPCKLRIERDHYWMLVKSILSQQLSAAAARTIRNRVIDLLPNGSRAASDLDSVRDEDLRLAGVSNQKIGFVRSLTTAVLDGRLCFSEIEKLENDAVVDALVTIKGIGPWTADMFLIFSLGRLDVFPSGDAGVRSAMRRIYEIDSEASLDVYETVANKWRPYASIASWYCWRVIDQKIF
ncbi:DNA-3-methyladenine glycosylase family protein [Roseimaritima sediminicola]|uniref:DNA-3-methyladenine glycosylase family protein n=1 Tax=Roseimaritima sediminicola TaxID=2662066 RepID=UPI001298247C|nr:DNA-3-methyladenine glycosylase [Roseimaritima sediminicola]